MAEKDSKLQQPNTLTESSLLTAAVAVKPPAFDETSVTRWFSIVESQFKLANITSASTKFHHVLANLPVKVVNQLSDAIISSPDYDTLKQALVTLFTRSKPELFDSLVSQNKILCTKPTLYLQELRKLAAPLEVTDDFLKIKFLKALPNTIRPLLVTYDSNTSLEELARVADTLLDYSGASPVNNSVSLVSGQQTGTSSSYDVHRGRDVVQNHGGVYNRGSDTRPHTPRSSNDYFNVSIPNSVRAFHSGQRPRVCRYHLYYGHSAKSCRDWCILKSSQLKISPDSRPSSRSSSPAPRSASPARSEN